ncbi:hypothetical protein JFT91_23775 [Pseudomonas sp. TH08]|jgi:hypothetical protein|uniref:DUF6367 family protein n=1 Tax=unclassified Pseudomonas TaxID=196821 RepID=UPI000C6CF277|nr:MULTISPECIES: DUF6367 family protein [unclassified Pseudomonas]AUG10031.1 hypothetical protein CXQ82_26985 [Pseudomonas sp. S09G 359]MBK5525828.1 hypothetical protein [Pseudomonas sp. TH06]MBK5535558.1 hypothetical protein [Pseudomonas sp. TH08]
MSVNDSLRKPLDSEPDGPYGEITDISIILTETALSRVGVSLESHWKEAGKGWMYRVDSADPKIPQLRHVHIAKTKNKSAKNMQVSWNVDGTRHDKASFNVDLSKQKYVRELAMRVLKLSDTVSLENADTHKINFEPLQSDVPTASQDGSEVYIRFGHIETIKTRLPAWLRI